MTRKIIHSMLAVLLAFFIMGCKDSNDEPNDPPKTLDQRLVGGRWYFCYRNRFYEPSDNGYLEFKDDKLSYIYPLNSEISKTNIPVYSQDGVVYNKDTGFFVIEYKFHDKFPYRELSALVSDFSHLDDLAADNNLITCPRAESLVNSVFPSLEDIRWQFLIRFHDDGTPYYYH
jgi:hypothetical protein